VGAAAPGHPPRADAAANCQHLTLLAEEDEVELEAHAKGVHARATGDQQAGSSRAPVETAQAEEASAKAPRNRDIPAADAATREAAQPPRQ
jgi:hypothetical protein